MFQFKQFTIRQDRTAMKVCTDACLLGAYASLPENGATSHGAGGRVLDIGTGTGLLALMAAQRSPDARIDAVELDEAAYGQALENVAASPFADRLRAWHTSVQAFTPGVRYDCILTNPPFYTNHLRSPDAAANRALHNDELPFADLVTAVQRLLKRDGQWWVLLPPAEMERLANEATAVGLRPFHQLSVRHHALKPIFRVIWGFSYQPAPAEPAEICFYERDGRTYSEAFRRLLEPFYLIF